MTYGHSPVTLDTQQNETLIEAFDASDQPHQACWELVQQFGIDPPFDRKRFSQPFTIVTTDDGEVIEWPDMSKAAD